MSPATARKLRPAAKASAERAPGRAARRSPPRWGLRALVLLVVALTAWIAIRWAMLPGERAIKDLARATPSRSAMMTARIEEARAEGTRLRLRHQHVPLSRISPLLQRAVVLSEDASFWVHDGVDWTETRKALAGAWDKGRLGRGASTITMQLAKNLWLGERRSLVRKLEEWILARRIERELKKRRILELYLNFAEWGPGIFGAEAAARAHFRKGAAELDAGEAAVLAAMLPAPRQWSPARPTPRLIDRSYRIAELLARDDSASPAGVRARVQEILGKPPRAGK